MNVVSLSKRIGLGCAAIHLLAFVATVTYVYSSAVGQAGMVWGFWAVIDFPISLLYFAAGESYSTMLNSLSRNAEPLAHILYLPHIIHGLLGTAWWYILPTLVLPRRFGGAWGR